ncbi:MAG: hypothetical protein NWE93_11480 [Candidatus Bathyarchaeota archaeon]|nr:hypothetical protein [Candidatus Bathyarchaeota archaeon]
MAKNSSSKISGTKAGALLCPICCVEYMEVEFDCEVDGVVLHNVKALRCPRCQQEALTPQQQQDLQQQLGS